MALVLFYLANIYTLSYPALDLTLFTRSGIYVKVIAFAAVTAGIVGWVSQANGRNHQLRLGAVALLIVATLHKNLDIGEGLLLVIVGVILLLADGAYRPWRWIVATALAAAGLTQMLGQGWGVLHVAPFSPAQADFHRLATIGMAAVFCVFAAFVPAAQRRRTLENPAHPFPAPREGPIRRGRGPPVLACCCSRFCYAAT